MPFFNIFDLVEEEPWPDGPPNGVRFAVDPARMYPVMKAHILDFIKSGGTPPAHLQVHYQAARLVSEPGWEAMETPRNKVNNPEVIEDRAEALECTRRWFTAMLHATVGGAPLGVHILKNEDWRL